ncbi:MAG: hypothetical protein P8O10_03340 [Pseudorhodobacter sp.]|jgi:hypothetical protein|nr:hypothetical protein [Pseudorhodobacter sp.]
MNPDILMVTGVLFGILALPSLLSAYADSRFPGMALFLFLLCAVLSGTAYWLKPGGYALHDIPFAIFRVIGFFRM